MDRKQRHTHLGVSCGLVAMTTSQMGREVMVSELEAASHIMSTVRKQKETSRMPTAPFSSESIACGMVPEGPPTSQPSAQKFFS